MRNQVLFRLDPRDDGLILDVRAIEDLPTTSRDDEPWARAAAVRCLLAEIGELVIDSHPGRTAVGDVTLFKSLGMALEDVATARVLYQRARSAQTGTWLTP